jgi:peptidoglycan/LPS O-acetylase OafA/YrhL
MRVACVLSMIGMNVLQDNFLLGIVTVPFAYTVQALCAAYLICSYVFNRTGLGYAILNTRPVVYIGALSYSVYIWQQLFFSTPQLFSSYALTFPFNLMLILATAIASYHLLELPLVKFRSKFRPRQHRDAARSPQGRSRVLQVGRTTAHQAFAGQVVEQAYTRWNDPSKSKS